MKITLSYIFFCLHIALDPAFFFFSLQYIWEHEKYIYILIFCSPPGSETVSRTGAGLSFTSRGIAVAFIWETANDTLVQTEPGGFLPQIGLRSCS